HGARACCAMGVVGALVRRFVRSEESAGSTPADCLRAGAPRPNPRVLALASLALRWGAHALRAAPPTLGSRLAPPGFALYFLTGRPQVRSADSQSVRGGSESHSLHSSRGSPPAPPGRPPALARA